MVKSGSLGKRRRVEFEDCTEGRSSKIDFVYSGKIGLKLVVSHAWKFTNMSLTCYKEVLTYFDQVYTREMSSVHPVL